MAEPTQVRPTQVTQDLTPPEKVIESLQVPPPRATTPENPVEEDPIVVPPLSWEEVIPSSAELKGILGKTAVWLGGFILALGLWILAVQMLVLNAGHRLPSDRMQEIRVEQKVPEVTSRPSAAARPPLTGQRQRLPEPAAPEPVIVPQPTRLVPENLTARIFSPLMVELNWDPVGEAYRYRLYSAQTSAMTDARLETDRMIVTAHYMWPLQDDISTVWLAVSSIDPEGRESPLSRPLLLRLR